jgi:release factor glutamine methyltransferase
MGAAAVSMTVGEMLADTIARLAAAGVAEARADAEVLLAHALGTTRAGLVVAARRAFPVAARASLEALVSRRAAREPLHYLVGEREFWSLPLAVDRRVLIPRPETELVVETALRVAPGARRILDVGTGSGAVAAALARELPGARVWASDLDGGALCVARANLARHAPRVGLVRGDVLAPFRAGAFDLVVSNPPYVADEELLALAPEVREHEPRVALAAGPDGLAVLRALAVQAPGVLAPGGWLVVEMGVGQAAAMAKCVVRDARYGQIRMVRDPAGTVRVLAAECRGGEEGGGGWVRR